MAESIVYKAFLGAYTTEARGGITCAAITSDTVSIAGGTAAPARNPSWLTQAGGWLLATVEADDFVPGQGGVRSWRLGAGGTLAEAGAAPSGGAGPCHLYHHPGTGRVYASNYGSGTLGVLRLAADGALALVDTLHHPGQGARVHCTAPAPDGDTLYVCDLGLDAVMVYRGAAGTDGLCLAREIALPAGSGPRHAVCSADGRWLYVVGEHSCEVYCCEAATGRLAGMAPVLPERGGRFAAAAAIRLYAGGTRLAVSCRGVDCLSFFDILPGGGLRRIQTLACRHAFPRDFDFLPGDEGRILVAYEKGNCLELWRAAGNDAMMMGEPVPVSCPVSICWMKGV